MEFYKNKSLESLTIIIPYNEWICDKNCTDDHLIKVTEEWKPIQGCEHFFASTFGRIKAEKRYSKRSGIYLVSKPEKILTQTFDKRGYVRVNIKYQTHTVHKLCGLTFHENPENKRTINHKIPIKTRNWVNNIEWSTDKENKKHAVEHGLSVVCYVGKGKDNPNSKPIQQLNLDGSLVRKWDCAEETWEYGFNALCISRTCRGLQPKHKGFIWRYAL